MLTFLAQYQAVPVGIRQSRDGAPEIAGQVESSGAPASSSAGGAAAGGFAGGGLASA